MVLQAFIDDSYSDGVYVLAGHIASAEVWAAFSKDWLDLMPFAKLSREGRRRFKMTEMHNSPDLVAFVRAIENHGLCALSFHFRIRDLERARQLVLPRWRPAKTWGDFNNNYLFSFCVLMGMFHKSIDKIAPLAGQKVDFFFDKQTEQKLIWRGWEEYVENQPEPIRSRYGSQPRFEDDEEFPPLQAADFFAGYVRLCAERGFSPGENSIYDWKPGKPMYYARLTMSQDQIVQYLAESAARQGGSPVLVYGPRLTKPWAS